MKRKEDSQKNHIKIPRFILSSPSCLYFESLFKNIRLLFFDEGGDFVFTYTH